MGRVLAVVLVAVVALTLASCSDSAESTTSAPTTTALRASTTVPPPASAGTPPTVAPTTTATASDPSSPPPTIPPYTIGARVRAVGGDTVVVVLPPGQYSDTDLEDVAVDAVQRFAPIATLHIVDSDDGVALVLVPEADLTAADAAVLEVHYLARLEEGFRLVFEGPFAEVDAVIIGS